MADFQLDSDAPEVAVRLARAAAELSQLEPVNRQAGAIVTAAPAPHRSGQLGASVRADVDANGLSAAGHTRYWTFVHWGAPGRHVVAQPWLLTQLQTHEAAVLAVYTDHATATVAHI